MTARMPSAEKEYTSAFVLDGAKLSRMLAVLEEKFTSSQLAFKPGYDVTLTNGKKITVTSLDALLKLDNTIRNPIRALTIEAVGTLAQGDLRCVIGFDTGWTNNVTVHVDSRDSASALRILAELEEQIERTFPASLVYKLYPGPAALMYLFVPLWLLFVGAIVLLFGSAEASSRAAEQAVAKELLQQSAGAASLEDKVNFLFELGKSELERSQAAPSTFSLGNYVTLQNVAVALPLLVVLGCIVYAVIFCYPHGVFLWGDYQDHYSQLVSRRNSVWYVVVMATVVGVLANLLFFGLSTYMRIVP